MADISIFYQYGSNVWEERFKSVSVDASNVGVIQWYTGRQYTFGLVINSNIPQQSFVIEEYLNGSYRTQRQASVYSTTYKTDTYKLYGTSLTDRNPIPIISDVDINGDTTDYVIDSNVLGRAIYEYFNSSSSIPLYVGVNGKARQVTDMYVGVNGKARKVTAIYVGVNGKARKVF